MKALALWLALVGASWAEPVLVQSTTSTQNSGLYDWVLPQAEAALGFDIRVVAVGTGQALKNAERCDGDLVIVHAKEAEDAFVASGYGTERRNLMFNDFVIVGPGDDPAGLKGVSSAGAALARIAEREFPFASRGDDSGTHKKELALWPDVSAPLSASGGWYRETGSGMGATLNLAVGMGAYALTDRATWLSFGNKGGHEVVFEGDGALFNQYGVIPVNAAHCPNVNSDGATALRDWLVSDEGQAAIAAFRIDGQQVFFPNAD